MNIVDEKYKNFHKDGNPQRSPNIVTIQNELEWRYKEEYDIPHGISAKSTKRGSHTVGSHSTEWKEQVRPP